MFFFFFFFCVFLFFFSFARLFFDVWRREEELFVSLSLSLVESTKESLERERAFSRHISFPISFCFGISLFSLSTCALRWCWFCHRKLSVPLSVVVQRQRRGLWARCFSFARAAGRERKSQTFSSISLCIIDFIPLDFSSGDKRERERDPFSLR